MLSMPACRATHAERLHAIREAPHIAADERAEVGVEHRGREPLVLAELGRDVGGERHVESGQVGLYQLGGAPLVRRIEEGVEEADGERFHAAGRAQRLDGGAHIGVAELLAHAAVGEQPLGGFQTPLARDERRRLVGLQIVEVGTLLAGDLQQVAKSARGEQRGARALLLEQRVGGHGGAVGHEAQGGRRESIARGDRADAGQDALGRIGGHARQLEDGQPLTRLVPERDVRERPADVDSQPGHERVG